MKRTQLYLDEAMWKVLQISGRQSGSSISELVRQALRDKYLPDAGKREKAFRSVIGLWKDRADLPDTEKYVRDLRGGDRQRRISG